ncbi:MAG TPA: hypothetical protein VFK39_10645, partial [Gemmatimonadaceae bacterium]|nr:hypothetical protein [Gemmatimonadaceae bacterium]
MLELVDVESSRNLVRAPAGSTRHSTARDPGIWQLELLGGDTITATAAHNFDVERMPRERALRLTWKKFDVEGARDLGVTVTVRLDADSALSEWHVALSGAGALEVERVHFPRIVSIASLGANERLAVPRWMGALAKDPRALLTDSAGRPRRLEWVYPGALSLQALALYEENGPGFYAASHDTMAYHKTFAVWGNGDSTTGFELAQLLENPAK